MSRVISTDGALSPLGVMSITDGDLAPLTGLSAGVAAASWGVCEAPPRSQDGGQWWGTDALSQLVDPGGVGGF